MTVFEFPTHKTQSSLLINFRLFNAKKVKLTSWKIPTL